MTVKELKELLNEFNDEDLIILSKDSEGNYYSPLSDDYFKCSYKSISSWGGQVGFRELTNDLIKDGYTEDDLIEDGVNAIAFYPIN